MPYQLLPDGSVDVQQRLEALPGYLERIQEKVFLFMDLHKNPQQINLQPAQNFLSYFLCFRPENPLSRGIKLDEKNLESLISYWAILSNAIFLALSWLRDLLQDLLGNPPQKPEKEKKAGKKKKKGEQEMSGPEIIADMKVNGFMEGGSWALLTQEGKHLKLQQWGIMQEREAKGNINILNPYNRENPHRYTSYLHVDKVKAAHKDFLRKYGKK